MTKLSAPRTVKTPAARAQEAVDVLERRLAKIRKQQSDLERQAEDLDPEIAAVQKRLDYAKASPDLGATSSPKRPQDPIHATGEVRTP